MKRWICALTLLLLLSITYLANADDGCTHRYKLLSFADDRGYYLGVCTKCETSVDVYPIGFNANVDETVKDGECAHCFRMADTAKYTSIVPTNRLYHESAAWYDCYCERCGLTFEAYLTDNVFLEHVFSERGEVHIDGTLKHLYAYCCDVCGELLYDPVNCFQYEDGTCDRSPAE